MRIEKKGIVTFLFGEKHAIARERNIMPKQQFIHRKGGRWKKTGWYWNIK